MAILEEKINNKVKVAITCNVYGNCGGMETFAYNLVSEFIKKNINIVVIAKEVSKNKITNKCLTLKKVNCKLVPRCLEDFYFSLRVKIIKKRLKINTIISCCRCIGSDIVVCGGTHLG